MIQWSPSLQSKLDFFCETKQVPNIIFYGPSGGGKSTLIQKFIKNIYNFSSGDEYRNYVMTVNCAHGTGIRFIREDLKFFSKTKVNCVNGIGFKIIVLLNADKLTIEAQSALRRCIEIYTHTTRFFILIENYHLLMNPIRSRFCIVYVPLPHIKGCRKPMSLYEYNINNELKLIYDKYDTPRKKQLIQKLSSFFELYKNEVQYSDIIILGETLYKNGYSAIDISKLLQDDIFKQIVKKNKVRVDVVRKLFFKQLINFQKIRQDIRNEEFLIIFVLSSLINTLVQNLI
tara:strand:+ start:103 stop:963 length:861 start_codon:yes stop_codon:yes gene_type:complete